ncbi:DUF6498-containing protein [Wenzhouxiangella sp. XN24]|uniref:DUF6498-containing protein n=1 Tax=Wenzhouxiangella sp. XN24 TaxID=2713569 RepID=UPI0013EA7427|nr:DUF6498-containing protein [Wenzhouxiangella sp. XN24]NGX16071.1 hypothetical protein [Wenzhouxiangella sp. XN24]
MPVQAALVLANLVPLAGVLFFGWDALALLLLYWLENLVIGGYTLLRMLRAEGAKALGMGAFFTFHYGFFCAIHGVFVLSIASIGTETDLADGLFPDDAPFPVLPFLMLANLLEWIGREMPGLLFLPLLGFVVSHGLSFFEHVISQGEDEGRSAQKIMGDPYRRIALMHVAILAGSAVIIGLGGGTAVPMLLVLVALKTWIDLVQHRKAHQRRAAEAAA